MISFSKYKKVLLILFLSLFFGKDVFSEEIFFKRSLSLGDSGPDVKSLQIILNSSLETAVSLSGIGSSGQETEYFGQKTANAVVKFQEKYRKDILGPAGLYYGTGNVGDFTRKKLNSLYLSMNPSKNDLPVIVQKPTSSSTFTTDIVNAVQKKEDALTLVKRSNLENMEWYIDKVKETARNQGFEEEKIVLIEKTIRDTVEATTTDLKADFTKQLKVAMEARRKEMAMKAESDPNPFVRVFTKISMNLENLFPKAEASIGVPFGGRLMYTFPCTCSGAWSVGLIPTGPTYAPILSVYAGSQAYAYYSAPFALHFLGTYIPGVQACWMYAVLACFPFPSYGIMTPFLGTAL